MVTKSILSAAKSVSSISMAFEEDFRNGDGSSTKDADFVAAVANVNTAADAGSALRVSPVERAESVRLRLDDVSCRSD